MKLLSGIRVPHRKNTAALPAVSLPTPKEVEIPMAMHIGAPAVPVVQVGDLVKVGQKIGEAEGFVSSPVYASVSGKVTRISERTAANGRSVRTVVIASDGEQSVCETCAPPQVQNLQEFLAAVRESGLVGLGGAGFPTAVKLSVKDLSSIRALIVNGAECEPYITSDTRTMLDRADEVLEGVKLVQKYLEIKQVLFGIEKNKPECIAKYRELTKDEQGMRVCALPAVYPQGGEKVLIYHTLGAVVPEGKLPIDAGAIVLNCTTLAELARYFRTGVPLTQKCITVSGSAVREPKNVIVPIGMRLADVFEAAGGFSEEPGKVLCGGPMMGIAVPDLTEPVLKNTNAILAFTPKDSVLPEPTACIRCGKCIAHCPLRLMPVEMEMAYRLNDLERLKALKVGLCMECGCCSFGCPAHRPLVQTNKLAKALLAQKKEGQK